VVGGIFILRRALGSLLANLRTVRYRQWQADFDRQLRDAEASAELLPEPAEEAQGLDVGEPAGVDIELLARVSPRAAVIEAWLLIEHQMVAVAQRHDVQMQPVNVRRLADLLVKQGVLDESLQAVIRDLNFARNSAVHGIDFALTPAEAQRYVELATRVAEALRRV
jgi:hypothetical protein